MWDNVKDQYASAVVWVSNRVPVKPAGKKLLVIGTASLFALWFLFLFGPSPATVASHIDLPPVPKISIDLHPDQQSPTEEPPQAEIEVPTSPYNESKVALLIEDRPIAHLAPLMLHFISLVPQDWKFVFMGSDESIKFINNSLPIQAHERSGKLDFVNVPSNVSVKGQEELSVTMTTLWFWEFLGARETWNWEDPYTDEIITGKDGKQRRRPQVEWMLVFQTDSIMCANSKVSLNDWLQYDWVGAPWNIHDRFGGNGGLSLRRLSRIIQVLKTEKREPHTSLEDLWLVQRIGLLPGVNMANGSQESHFSVEAVWQDEPMGYHMGWSGARLPDDVWGTAEKRKKVFDWCPEIKMVLGMKLEREGCDDKKKRDLDVEERELFDRIKPW
ncbi:hypothetical protein RUND412_009651 [Rhizina undulata]